MSIYDIKNHTTDRLFRLRIVRDGDSYGRDMCQIHEGSPMAEFYDATYDFETAPDGAALGQFVSRYMVDTLLGKDGYSSGSIFESGQGLNLDGGVPVWTVDPEGMADVEAALLQEGLIEELTSEIAIAKSSKEEPVGPGL